MATKWDETRDQFIIFKTGASFWKRVKLGLLLVRQGFLSTGIRWFELEREIKLMKDEPASGAMGTPVRLDQLSPKA